MNFLDVNVVVEEVVGFLLLEFMCDDDYEEEINLEKIIGN